MAGGHIQLQALTKRFGDATAVHELSLEIRGGRVLLAAGAERLRQDHHTADDRRFRTPDQRPDPAGRSRRQQPASQPAQSQHRVPELCAVSVPHSGGQRGVRHEIPALDAEGGRHAPRRRGVGAGWPRGVREATAQPAVRRPTAARRAGASAGAAPGGLAARRAAGRARRKDPQAAAAGAQGAAGGGRDHVRVRHPRPGGGAQHERPDRGDECRAHRAGRHPERGL